MASSVSMDRGKSMTFVGIVTAAGHHLPPVFIIPRVKKNDNFMRGVMEGSLGLYRSNGWMDSEAFVECLKHIQKVMHTSEQNRLLLIMDNAEVHMSLMAVDYALENGITIVTLPPHCTAKMQPLDVGIFKGFKASLKVIINEFNLCNPLTPLQEHMLPEMASKAWVKACKPEAILNAFRATGI